MRGQLRRIRRRLRLSPSLDSSALGPVDLHDRLGRRIFNTNLERGLRSNYAKNATFRMLAPWSITRLMISRLLSFGVFLYLWPRRDGRFRAGIGSAPPTAGLLISRCPQVLPV